MFWKWWRAGRESLPCSSALIISNYIICLLTFWLICIHLSIWLFRCKGRPNYSSSPDNHTERNQFKWVWGRYHEPNTEWVECFTSKSLRQEGRYNDGAGLYLRVRKNGYKSWIFSRKIQGKKREVTLGDLEVLSLADAREEARKVRIRIKSGLPWVEEDKHEITIPTFLDVAKLVLETKDATWKNDKTRAQWHMTLKVYAKPLHDKKITDIKTPDVLKILQPIWLVKNETASSLRGGNGLS